METAYLIILSVGLLVRWVRSAGRFSNIEQRLDYLAQAQEIPDVAALTERIYNLEREVAELRSARVQLQPETARVMNVEPELQHQTPGKLSSFRTRVDRRRMGCALFHCVRDAISRSLARHIRSGAGVSLLRAIAAGMIGHSFRYRSETITAPAYFIAFATLAITPLNALSVIALIPLAASLLFVAYRFSWSTMAVFGLIATYGTCAMKGDSGAPLWQAQALFSTYWLLFETFDLMRAGRRTPYNAWERVVFPLNAVAIAGLSYGKWPAAAPEYIYAPAAGIAAAYLTSSLA